jgi:hypothetical protein
MKQKLLCIVIFCSIFFYENSNAQKKIDCESNFREALFYLKGDKNFKRDTIKSINYLKPCLKVNDANAQLLMGRIYLSREGEINQKKGFKLIKKSALQGNYYAIGDLGVLYKYGRGVKQNYNKARKWFKKGSEIGNSKATYSLGYMYLKGFGNIKQDYRKAIKWFRKSNHKMAKYWLGVCYYYGYGVKEDKVKAKTLIGDNFDDSNVNLTNSEKNSELKKLVSLNSLKTIEDEKLYGKYSGILIKYDWSGKHIEIEQKLNLEFKYDSINEQPAFLFEMDNQKIVGSYSKIDNSVYFKNLNIELPHLSLSKKIRKKLLYQVVSTNLQYEKKEGEEYLAGNLNNQINSWKEDGALLRFVLKKKKSFSNSNKELSDDALEALAAQKDKFIKLYPNPFTKDLVVSYTLEKPSTVTVYIKSLKGQKSISLVKNMNQDKGEHTYLFNGTDLKKGIYVVSIIAGKTKKTRIIVKK